MADLPLHQAYFGLRYGETKDTWTQFTYGTELEALRNWATQAEKITTAVSNDVPDETAILIPDTSVSTSDAEHADGPTKPSHPLAEAMSRVAETGLALSELNMASGGVGSLFSSIVSRVEVVEPVKSTGQVIEETDTYCIYGISADRLVRVRDQHRRLVRMDRGFALLPSAVLLTVVSTFDSLISDIVRTMLSSKPDAIFSSEKTILVSDVLNMNSFEEVRTKLIDDEVYLFSRGSHEEQVKQIEKWFHIRISEHWKRWPDFIEIFERRNLIAHGEEKFTQRYVKLCTKAGHKGSEKTLNSPIELKKPYLRQSIDTLTEFGILLVFSIWRKSQDANEQEIFDKLNDVSYRMITEERYRVPVRVIEYALDLKGCAVSQSTRLMMTVNLASAHRHLKQDDKARFVLDEVDWSAASDNFRICVAALRDDVIEVCRLMELVVKAELVRKVDFREWPAFDYVRDKEEFRTAFENLFSEPLIDPTSEATEFDQESNDNTEPRLTIEHSDSGNA